MYYILLFYDQLVVKDSKGKSSMMLYDVNIRHNIFYTLSENILTIFKYI